jgi:Tfp pilus assembly protein PilF
LPEHAKFAVYREKPLPGEMPSLLAQAEGAMAIGDYNAAAEWIAAMSEAELKREATLSLRLQLAKATGRDELAERLEKVLDAVRSEAI